MHVSLHAPFEADPAQLVCVALALNHPVVAVEPLPGGPAAAAIVVEASGAAALVLRSQRSGAVAWLDAGTGDPERAFERALNRAEGLGFLFEQEAFAADSGLARELWPAWLQEVFADPVPGPAFAHPVSDPVSAPAEVARDVAGWLSKFRWALPESA